MNSSDNHSHSSIDDCRMLPIATIGHEHGNIAVMDNADSEPFDVRRVYYVYDVPAGAERGGHSHKATYEFVVALSGSFDVSLDDGVATRRVTLNSPDRGLLLTPGIWRTLDNFSSGAICLVMASEKYAENDYIRDYETFKQLTSVKK